MTETLAAAVRRLQEIWSTGEPAGRGYLRDADPGAEGRWSELAEALDTIAGITPEQRAADRRAHERWAAPTADPGYEPIDHRGRAG